MLHPVPRSVFRGFGHLGPAHGPRFPSALDILQEQAACPDTNTKYINNIVEYLEEQAANTTTTITTITNTPARGTPVATGRSVNEPSGLQLVGVDSSGSGTNRMSDVNDAAVSPKAAAGMALMESPFTGTYGLGISTSSSSSAAAAAVAVETSSGKPPSSGKASSSNTAPTRPWTADEDEALRGVMRTTPGRSWPEISKRAFPRGERNKHECCARWRILSTPKATKGPWTSEEDNLLLDLVEECGPEKWVVIATKIQTRSGKQCRERWHNHLDPAIKKTPFTAEEEEMIWRLYSQWGSKWAEIAKHLPGRPDNMIKNHFNTSVQRNKRKQRARATANTEGGNASQEGEDYAIPSIGLSSSHLKQEDLGDNWPSSATSASFVDSHGNPIGSGIAGGPPASNGPNTTYIKVARDRYLPYRRPLPRPSLLHAQHSSSSSSALGSPSIPSPGTPHSPYLSMPLHSATTSAMSPISFASSNSTSYMRGPLSASLPPSASPSQSGFMIHSHGPPGSAGGSYAHPPGSFRYPPLPTRGYSESHTTSPAPTTPHEFSPPLPGSPQFSAYPQYSHARTTQQGGPPTSAGGGGGVTFGFPRNSTNSHYQAYYPNSPVSASYLPIPGSPHTVTVPGSAQMTLSRSLPAQLSNPNSPGAPHSAAMSPAMSEGGIVQSGQVSSAVSPAISPAAAAAKAEHQQQERQSYFQQQQQQQNLYFPVVSQPQDTARQQSPNTQYSPQMESVGSASVSPAINQEEGTGNEKDAARITFRRIPGSTITSSQESGAMEYDNEQSYAVPRSARSMQSSLASPGSPASSSSASTAQQQGSQLSPLLPMIVTHRGSISSSGVIRPPFIHAATTTFLSPSTERLSIHTSMPSPTLSPHMSTIPPASAPPTVTSMVGNPASGGAPGESRMSPHQYHHHHPHSPYYYTHPQQQGFSGLSPEYVHRSEMQQQQWHAQRHYSPLPDTARALPSPLSISANYDDAQRQDEEMQFPRPDRATVPHSPYVAPASTLMSTSTSASTVTSTSTAGAVEVSSPASSSLVTPPQQHEDRMPSIHLQYGGHEGSTGLASHGESAVEHGNRIEDLKEQANWQKDHTIEESRIPQEVNDTYDQDMQ